jgi:putative spermidine/putrescine transport system ATP-binding protein
MLSAEREFRPHTVGPIGEPGGTIALHFDHVTKRFGNAAAISDLSLEVLRGELLTLLGPSGCGKTTLLNLVAGFFSPDSGSISIDGRLVNDVPTHKREIGLVFQSYALFPHMTVATNVAYGLRTRRLPKREIARRVGDVLSLVKLDGLQDRKPRQLSGGQQQRVALARALVINPKVLLLDEPFSALDKNLRESMQIELREIQRNLGVTTIFVTHDQSEALSLSDRIVVMAEGRIRQVGTPQEVYANPRERFVASFVGDVNMMRGKLVRIEQSHAIVEIGTAQITVPVDTVRGVTVSTPVDLFVRPEHLRLIEPDKPCASAGTVVAQVYQGTHIDVYIECVDSTCSRLLARLSTSDGTKWPVGVQVGISIGADKVIAFVAT